jgi:hypothetical protein
MRYYVVPIVGTGLSIGDPRRPAVQPEHGSFIDLLDGTMLVATEEELAATEVTAQQASALVSTHNPEAAIDCLGVPLA